MQTGILNMDINRISRTLAGWAMTAVLTMTGTSGCVSLENADPYSATMNTLTVNIIYPEDFQEYRRAGVMVGIEDINSGNSYSADTDENGTASMRLSSGLYRVTVSDRTDEHVFNGSADKVNLTSRDMTLSISLAESRSGAIVIKEIYNGGCPAYPLEGTYQSDKYVILHNNSNEVQYLDGLCFGTLDPYNSQGTNVWVTEDPQTGASIYPDFVPIAQVIWQFGGDGTTFPLQPGEDAVIACCGAIDHTVQYPMSVNLNRPGYFVCYNNVYFPNTTYHPAPGNNIDREHYLDVVVKTGQANAFTFSVFSPAVVIFKAKDISIQEHVGMPDVIMQKPGSTTDRIVKIPVGWIMDGVDVFFGGSSSNSKRLNPAIDAGYVTLSGNYLGHTLHRKTDEALTAAFGYEVLTDTNNSMNDFYEREIQSLHE